MGKETRLWTDDELYLIGGTIEALRKSRSAVTAGLQQPTLGNLFSRLIHPERFQDPKDRQAILTDAENLAFMGGRYIAKRISKNTTDPSDRQAWKDSLDQALEKLKPHTTSVTHAKTTNLEVAGYLFAHTRALRADPNYVLNWDLFTLNNLGSQNLQDLLRRENLVVVSPLSGDLYIAAIDKAYLELNRRAKFRLRAAASTPDLKYFVLPDLSREIAEGVTHIAVFLDVMEEGKTGRALVDALKLAYPDLLIHDQDFSKASKLELEQSEKIKRAQGIK